MHSKHGSSSTTYLELNEASAVSAGLDAGAEDNGILQALNTTKKTSQKKLKLKNLCSCDPLYRVRMQSCQEEGRCLAFECMTNNFL